MKNDARFLLNKKKWKNSSGNRATEIQRVGARPTVDARKILNLKRSKNQISPNKQIFRGSQKFNQSGKGIFTKAFSAVSKAPDKRIKLTTDGNILITAKAKDNQMVAQSSQRLPSYGVNAHSSISQVQVAQSSQRLPSFGANAHSSISQVQKPVLQWVPADVEMDNLEHIGINDLLDMESLPSAVVSSNLPQSRQILARSSSDRIAGPQNTMIADQIASTSHQVVQVIVTNLHSSVSKQDIMELFGDVGIVKNVQMPQPGTAAIEFFDPEDAAKACSTYHNRLLDGHPMKCYLQANSSPQRASVSQRLGGRIETISPIASSSSFASNPRSRYNPRDVRFTVKLT